MALPGTNLADVRTQTKGPTSYRVLVDGLLVVELGTMARASEFAAALRADRELATKCVRAAREGSAR